MDKKKVGLVPIVIGTLAVLAIVAGAFMYVNASRSSPVAKQDSSRSETQTAGDVAAAQATSSNSKIAAEDVQKGTDAIVSNKGSYQTYAPEKIALAKTGHIVLFFQSSACTTCRVLDSDILAMVSAIPKGLTILKVDYDKSTALTQKYGVTSPHTLVQVSSDGSLVAKWSGSPTLAALVANIKL